MTKAALARIGRRHPLRVALDDLLTRCFYSAAGYVFESDPYVVPEDDELLRALGSIREDDRRHAHVLGALVQGLGGVPGTGVFPWWNLDLNYLTVPCLGRFVVDAIEHEIGLYASLIAKWPAEDAGARAALESILSDKQGHVAALRPVVLAATKREEDEGKAKIQAIKNARNARLAKEKAAKEAAKKAAAAAKAAPGSKVAAVAVKPAAGLLDPKEPGISSKEKGRRTVLKMRAAMGIGAPVAVSDAAPAAGSAPAAAPAPAAPAAGALLDPNEPGISPKEKAKRQIAKQRAAAAPAAAIAVAAAPAPAAAPPASVVVPDAAPLSADLGDPDEPGLLPKEKARRQIARMRAKKAAGG